MTIVCATHFTSSSLDAVVVAAHLARRTKQALWLVNVVPGLPLGSTGPRENKANEELHREAGLLRAEGLVVEVALLHGKVARALGRLCTDVNAKLLVVGDTSHTKRTLFATPVEQIAAGASVPLLVVRSKQPFEAWAQGERPLRVLLGIDSSWSSSLAREWLTGLAAYGSLEVLASHIWHPEAEYARHGAERPMLESDEVSMAELITRDVTAALTGLPGNVTSRVQLEVGRGSIGELLLSIAARERMDMLVVGTHPHRGLLSRLTSVTHDVLKDALMSVALVPAEGPSVEEFARSSPTSPLTLTQRARRSSYY